MKWVVREGLLHEMSLKLRWRRQVREPCGSLREEHLGQNKGQWKALGRDSYQPVWGALGSDQQNLRLLREGGGGKWEERGGGAHRWRLGGGWGGLWATVKTFGFTWGDMETQKGSKQEEDVIWSLALDSGSDLSFFSIQLLSCVWLFVTPWTAAHQASLSITSSQSLLKLLSIVSVMLSNHLILCHPFLLPQSFSASRSFQWVSSLHQVAQVLEFQLQHQSFQWIFKTDFLLRAPYIFHLQTPFEKVIPSGGLSSGLMV